MSDLTIGMATYDDFEGVYFTLAALRLYQDLEEVELLVVDNFGCEATKEFVESWTPARYVLANEIQGTARPRDRVFEEARGNAVLCCDSHVLFAPKVIGKLVTFYREHPGCDDLLQGPLLYDDLSTLSTHFDPEWRAWMWGTWGTDPRGVDRDSPPFEIRMQGLGVFSCRREAWLGFNPRFRGFGGEEGYIHEKFRQAGRRVLCLPWFRWTHRFVRPGGVPYRNTLEDRLHNYVVGHAELGLDLAPVIEHFSDFLPEETVARVLTAALWGTSRAQPAWSRRLLTDSGEGGPQIVDTPDTVTVERVAAAKTSRGFTLWAGLGSKVPGLLLVGAIVSFAAVYGPLVYRRHDRFASFTLDMAIYDQATWLISQNDGLFMSIRGLGVLGHHATFGLWLLAPFYWLGAGPHFLNLVQVGSLALGAVPVYLIARDRARNSWLGLLMAAAFLLHPSLGFFAWELFHPESMAITGLLFAYWFAIRRRWAWFSLALVYAVSWKEDVALSAAALGVVLLAWREWRAGLITFSAGIAYSVLVNRWMLPSVAGSTFYNHLFGDLGETPTEVARTTVEDPLMVAGKLVAADARMFMWQLAGPFGLLSVLGPLAFLVGAPQFFVDLISSAGFTRVYTFHYAALPLVGITLASIEGMAWITRKRPSTTPFVIGLVAASALAGAVAWGVSPVGHEYDKGWWPLVSDARLDTKRRAVRIPPGDASVAATYHFTPHLTHRRSAYDFPSPWFSSNWGVNGENLPDPNVVGWLVVDRQDLGASDLALLDHLIRSGEFRALVESNGIVVARRSRRDTGPRLTRDDLAQLLVSPPADSP